MASVLFLIDGNLLCLQPFTTEAGELKYDLRVVVQEVEHFILARDDIAAHADPPQDAAPHGSRYSLEDSLWVFTGQSVKVWPDVHDVLDAKANTVASEACITIAADFCPFSVSLHKGIIAGAEAELTQRRDVNLAYFRTVARVSLAPRHRSPNVVS